MSVCMTCHGAGCDNCDGEGKDLDSRICVVCHGAGCRDCDGTGQEL